MDADGLLAAVDHGQRDQRYGDGIDGAARVPDRVGNLLEQQRVGVEKEVVAKQTGHGDFQVLDAGTAVQAGVAPDLLQQQQADQWYGYLQDDKVVGGDRQAFGQPFI